MRLFVLMLTAGLALGCDRNQEPVRPGEQLTALEEDPLEESDEDEESEAIETATKVEGGLNESQVQAVIDDEFRGVQECFDAALARGSADDLSGAIVVEFVVAASGTVDTSEVAASAFDDEAAGECIAEAVRAWTFPKPRKGKTAKVRYAFFVRSY